MIELNKLVYVIDNGQAWSLSTLTAEEAVNYMSCGSFSSVMITYKQKDGTFVGQFIVSPFPACSHIIISHGLYIDKEYRRSDHSNYIRKERQALFKASGASLVLATGDASNKAVVGNFNKMGYLNLAEIDLNYKKLKLVMKRIK